MNLLVGTENGLMLLDRSGQGKVYSLISRRRFQQMDVLEGLNLLTTISGEKPRPCVPGCRQVQAAQEGGGRRCLEAEQGDAHTTGLPTGWPSTPALVFLVPSLSFGSSGLCGAPVHPLAPLTPPFPPQGRGISSVSTTSPGCGIRFCTTTPRWRKSRAGPPWGTWRAVSITVWVSRSWRGR